MTATPMFRVGWIALVLTLAAGALPPRVLAQAGDPLGAAEQAYSQVDFERTLVRAEEALQHGGYGRTQLIRIYLLIGISATAQGQEDRARDAYVRMLALDPRSTAGSSISPQFRGPYLEARGFWTSHEQTLGASVVLARTRGALRVDVGDPLNMVRTVLVRARLEGEREYRTVRHPGAAHAYIPVPGSREADRVEYSLALLDEHDNRLVEIGSDDDPRVVGRPTAPRSQGEEGRSVFASPWFWMAAAVVVGGGITAAAVIGANESGQVGLTTHVTTATEAASSMTR